MAKTIAMMATCRVTKSREGKSRRVMMTAVKDENSGFLSAEVECRG